MLPQDRLETPESALVTAILMQAYRDLFIAIKSDGSARCCQTNDCKHQIDGCNRNLCAQ
jgi:hypothetical protein